MVHDLSLLRSLTQALADLVKKRDEQHPDSSHEQGQLERMIRDLEAEIAIRNKEIVAQGRAGG
jgi:hypothetical protein